MPRADNDQADALARIGSTRQAIPTGVSLQRLLKPSIKPSPESDSIFVPPAPDTAGSDWRNPAGGTGTSTTGPGTAVVAPGPGTAAVGPGTATTQEAVADSNATPKPPTRVMVATLTKEEVTAPSWAQPTTQEAVADSNATPKPPTRVMVATLTKEEVTAPSWAQPILKFLVSRELPADEISARLVQRRAAAYSIINRELVKRNVTGVFQRCVEPEEVTAPSWAQPILKFLVSRELPADEISARLVQRRAGAYAIINRELVKRSVTGVFQRCVEPEKGVAILKDIHQGECGHHAASRSLVAKAFRHGFFWPTALEDAKEIVKSCRGCQVFSSKQHLPASALKTIPLTWPFAVWGLDMVGPFKTARGGCL